MVIHHTLGLPVRSRRSFPVGSDGLTDRDRRRRAKRYAETAAKKSSVAELDAWAADMRARQEAKSPRSGG